MSTIELIHLLDYQRQSKFLI